MLADGGSSRSFTAVRLCVTCEDGHWEGVDVEGREVRGGPTALESDGGGGEDGEARAGCQDDRTRC